MAPHKATQPGRLPAPLPVRPQVDGEKYDVIKEHRLVVLPGKEALALPCQELPQLVIDVCDRILVGASWWLWRERGLGNVDGRQPSSSAARVRGAWGHARVSWSAGGTHPACSRGWPSQTVATGSVRGPTLLPATEQGWQGPLASTCSKLT
jgi:hypothetical protein